MSRALRSLFDAVPAVIVSPVAVPARPPVPARQVSAGPVEHLCAVCGRPAGFGFGVFLRRGREGRWACLNHRGQVEGMPQ